MPNNMEPTIQAGTMALWEKGQLPKRRPWRGEKPHKDIYIPSGIIVPPTQENFWEEV